ncbi:MAG: AraC family transcriptional regulator, partial [Bacteroidota bacterium]
KKRHPSAVFLPYWHYHPELELTLISQGRGTRYIGDSIQNYQAHDLVLVGENLPHHWVSHPRDKLVQEAFVIQFSKTLFIPFPECKALDILFQRATRGLQFSIPCAEIIDQIQALVTSSAVQQLATLLSILDRLSREESLPLASSGFRSPIPSSGRMTQEVKKQDKIAQTTQYILEHLDQKLTVNHMAERTHMVPQSFCRWFRQHTGHSFISFLNQSRIRQACHLLQHSSLQVQEIAFDCGFESVPHFNRVFKQLMETNPLRFRAEQRSRFD